MTALAQGSAGLALVIGFALLGTRQIGAAAILLVVQSLAVAVAALAQHQPLIAAATVAVDVIGAHWFIRRCRMVPNMAQPIVRRHDPASGAAGTGGWTRSPIRRRDAEDERNLPHYAVAAAHHQRSAAPSGYDFAPTPATSLDSPAAGTKLSIVAGAGLAVLCQSCGLLAPPLAVVLLSILLAATRQHPLSRLVALISLQNGVALAACLEIAAPLPALACFVLPLAFAAGLALGRPTQPNFGLPAWLRQSLGRIQVIIAAGLFIGSLTVPLDPLAAVFAPLIGVWGIAEAWAMRKRGTRSLLHRALALAKLGCMLIAVGTPQPVIAWLAVVGAITAAMLPTSYRRWDGLLLALCAAGLGLFGWLTIPSDSAAVAYTALFVGYAMIAAVVPELGVVAVIQILRLGTQIHLPAVAETILTCVAVAGLISCATPLVYATALQQPATTRHRMNLMLLAQTAIAAVAISLGLPQARFAAVILLILLILTRAAVRTSHGLAAVAARAGMAGIPPLGVFPGLVLVLLALSSPAPWLLLPVGLGLAAVGIASLPTRIVWGASSTGWPLLKVQIFASAGLLPLVLAFLFGFFAPDDLVQWLRAMTVGAP